jgi:hypothetical protein
MSVEEAAVFLNDWVARNVHSVAPPRNDIEAKRLARLCVEDAEKRGITRTELEQSCGQDLVKCMRDAQVAVADCDLGEF